MLCFSLNKFFFNIYFSINLYLGLYLCKVAWYRYLALRPSIVSFTLCVYCVRFYLCAIKLILFFLILLWLSTCLYIFKSSLNTCKISQTCLFYYQKLGKCKQIYVFFAAILFDDAILLGAENDTTLYASDSSSMFSLPFCVVNKTVSPSNIRIFT